MKRLIILAILASVWGSASVYAQSTYHVNPLSGDIWTYFGPTLGSGWGPATGGTGGSPPGGTSGEVQYNNSGSFGGFTLGGDASLNTTTGALTINGQAVTNTKLAFMSPHTYKGNNTGSIAAPLDVTPAQLTIDLSQFGPTSQGVVPGSGGGITNFLRADGSWTAPPGGGIPGGTSGQIQFNNAGSFGGFTTSGDATINTGTGAVTFATGAVTNTKMANMTAHTYKGNNTGLAAAPADITVTQLTADLNLFTSTLQGEVPGSGGGTANFLRADGTWALPPGSSVSITASTPNIVVTPAPITGTGTIGTQAVGNDQSAAGYTVLTGDNTKTIIIGAFTYTLPQAGSAGFLTQWSTCFLNKGAAAATINTTTSIFLAATGTTTLSVAPGDNVCVASDGTNWDTQVTRVASGTANSPLFAGGTGAPPTLGTRSGNTTKVVTTTGALTSGHCSQWDVSGNAIDSGGACGGASGALALISTISAPTTTGCGAINCFAWTGLTADKVEVKCHGIIGGNATQNIAMQFGTGAGPTWQTGATAYNFVQLNFVTGGGAPTSLDATAAGAPGPFQPATSGNAGGNYLTTAQGLTASGVGTPYKEAMYKAAYFDVASHRNVTDGYAYDNIDTVPITAIRLIDIQTTPVSIGSGSCSLYSVAD